MQIRMNYYTDPDPRRTIVISIFPKQFKKFFFINTYMFNIRKKIYYRYYKKI